MGYIYPFATLDLKNYMIMIALFIIVAVIVIVVKRPFRKKNTSYYREVPDNLPAVIIYYYKKGKLPKNLIWLTILDLIGRGYYSLDKKETEHYLKWRDTNYYEFNTEGLYPYEIMIIKYINTAIASSKNRDISLNKLHEYIKNDFNFAKKLKEIEDNLNNTLNETYGKVHNETVFIMAALFLLVFFLIWFIKSALLFMGILYVPVLLGLSMVLKNTELSIKSIIGFIGSYLLSILILMFPLGLSFKMDIYGWLLMLLYFNPILIFLTSRILTLRLYNDKQKELVLKILGLKKYLQDFTIINESDIDKAEFYSKYYVMAETLNVKLPESIYKNVDFIDSSFETLSSSEFPDYLNQVFNDINGF